MLSSHIVTLDYPGRQMLLDPRTTPAPARVRPGYGLAFEGEHAAVVQLFEASAAARAGLRLGDRVTAAQGRSLVVSPDNPRCSSARWLAESFDGSVAVELQVMRGDQVHTIRVPASE
jgi:predicted metalloprotease with PDZ domain